MNPLIVVAIALPAVLYGGRTLLSLNETLRLRVRPTRVRSADDDWGYHPAPADGDPVFLQRVCSATARPASEGGEDPAPTVRLDLGYRAAFLRWAEEHHRC